MSENAGLYMPPPILQQLAVDSLSQAANRDLNAAEASLERIYLGYGHQGLYYTYCTWADLVLNAMQAERRPDGTRLLMRRGFLEACVAFADWVNPPAAWAGKFVLARADWREEQVRELYAELRRHNLQEINQRILALVDLAVTAAVIGQVAE